MYDPIAGVFTILGPGGTPYTVSGFLPGDIPAPADYLGNGSTQPIVFRPNTGQFIGAGGATIATFGQAGDIPLAAPLSYRMPSSDPPNTGNGNTGGNTGNGNTGGNTGTGNTGNGNTGGNTGTGNTGNGNTGNGSGSSNSSTGSTSPPPAQNPGSGLTHPGTGTHKKTVAKHHKPKPVIHHKKPAVHKKAKTVQHPASKPIVHVVKHKVIKVVTAASTSASAKAKSSTHLVDLALEGIHANLRRSSSLKKHHG